MKQKNAIIIAVDETAIWRMTHTSKPHHIQVKIKLDIPKGTIVYIYRKATHNIRATGTLYLIQPCGEGCWEYQVTDWKNCSKPILVSDLDSKTITWIIDAEAGLAATPGKVLTEYDYVWIKPLDCKESKVNNERYTGPTSGIPQYLRH